MVQTMVKEDVPCSPWRSPGQRRWMCPKEAVTQWEVHTEAGFCQDLWRHGKRGPRWSKFAGRTCSPVGNAHWSRLFLKDCTLWKRPILEKFLKNCSPWEGLLLENFVEDYLLWERSHVGAEGESEESSPEEKVAETMCDELTATSFAVPLFCWWGVSRGNWEWS
ncbi:suppression of tumorigenicity 5 protein isoform x4 [Willisornis vidua]|uniref:Suppression of tumorigenicity 5 protein isoform x4 n=1 Tax=Willisornis vidua TaxID=1566151 RepID=A0ABQ9DKY2_9PASS|nr:suppression of tumorigenicity 5 protein isoform x4 [Willisornis vidua]